MATFCDKFLKSIFFNNKVSFQAYVGLGGSELPKVTYIVAQKTHHTKLFQDGRHENVPAGTLNYIDIFTSFV